MRVESTRNTKAIKAKDGNLCGYYLWMDNVYDFCTATNNRK